ncbi:MAG: peptidylprolyl isomerase [Acidimicrobiia bacterium]
MKRTLALLVAVIGATVLLSACGSNGGPAAAKVGSTTISRATLDDELEAITSNPKVTASFSNQAQVKLKPTPGGVSTKFATLWLTTLVNQAAIDEYFTSHHLKVTAQDRAAAKATVNSTFVNASTFKSLPSWFQKAVLSRQNRLQTVKASLPGPTEAQLAQVFEQTKAQSCPSGQVLAHIQVNTKEDADAIEAQLASGADFATLAKQRSTDTASAAIGGLYACTGTDGYNQLPAEFRTAADALAPGAISAPVQVQNTFQILKLEPWTVETAHPVLVQFYEQQNSPLTSVLSAQFRKHKVWVDPRYGTVVRSKTGIVIQPPVAPSPKTKPAEPTSTTAPAAATGQ